MSDYRVYAPDEIGADGYPPVWHQRLKHEVREAAGNRCVRCGHPYRNGDHGAGEWSECGKLCTHPGPTRCSIYGAVDVTPEHRAACPGFHDARWRILTVHHLSMDKADCRWWNLCALCQRCHLTIQGRVQMARVYPWEHSEWFKPYVAGYYAWTYLGEDLDREQTELRVDELLALELAPLPAAAADTAEDGRLHSSPGGCPAGGREGTAAMREDGSDG